MQAPPEDGPHRPATGRPRLNQRCFSKFACPHKYNGDLYINTDAGSTLTLDGAGRQLYSQAVTGLTTFVGGVLTKQGDGTWVIDKDVNIFTPSISPGSTIMKAGTLEVDATLPGTMTAH